MLDTSSLRSLIPLYETPRAKAEENDENPARDVNQGQPNGPRTGFPSPFAERPKRHAAERVGRLATAAALSPEPSYTGRCAARPAS